MQKVNRFVIMVINIVEPLYLGHGADGVRDGDPDLRNDAHNWRCQLAPLGGSTIAPGRHSGLTTSYPTKIIKYFVCTLVYAKNAKKTQLTIQGARGIAARFLKWSPASTVCPIMTKFSQYTPYSTCYLVLVSISRQD